MIQENRRWRWMLLKNRRYMNTSIKLKQSGRLLMAFFLTFFSIFSCAQAQEKGIYVDAKGVIRWEGSNKEAAFFGVNYTLPFAYAYRSHKALNVNREKAIKQDVYHFARLGLDAFRVHVWDTEISDSAGNLLQNDHLRLFDFLIAELKKRKIKILITPIAFWGNGYPEKDEKTPGFSAKFGKGDAVVKEEAIRAQENYLKQFFSHVNPYTKLNYRDDVDILATEINNEPKHSGPKSRAKEYVNRLAAAIRSTGWKKPVFYNISESPWYADAVANANIDGVSFQWYPTGLVANQELKGNFLPHVDKYQTPFDTIPAFKNKALMVYEFDAGDVMQPIMYPAMARSFRTAGFQWATQFAYDPMATAYANTEYQTHYLNLAYTPAKALSLLIANKVFHQVPRLKSYGKYPQSSVFENFRISYNEALSEMNSPEEFYYSNSTGSKPVNLSKLSKLAGVGSSSIVKYTGTGAYFLDKIENGVWRLEVMPDAISIRDPFEKASLKKEVTRIEWRAQDMTIHLSDLGDDFDVKALTEHEYYSSKAKGERFSVFPGTYLVLKKGKQFNKKVKLGVIELDEFVAPKTPTQLTNKVFVKHDPPHQVSENRECTIKATIAGVRDSARVTLFINQLHGEYKTIPMVRQSGYGFTATLPAPFLKPGMLNYRIVVEQKGDSFVFPGNHKGDPWAWDNYNNDTWKIFVAAKNSSLELFNAGHDQNLRRIPHWDDAVKISYTTDQNGRELVYSLSADKAKGKLIGFQSFIGDKLSGRISESGSFKYVVLKGKSKSGAQLKLSLINSDGQSFSALVQLNSELSELKIPISEFKAEKTLLLPRPYPGFQPLYLDRSSDLLLDIADVEMLEVSRGQPDVDLLEFELQSIKLIK